MPGVESERIQQIRQRLEDPRTRAWVNAIAYAARNPQISVEGTEMAIFELIQWIVMDRSEPDGLDPVSRFAARGPANL